MIPPLLRAIEIDEAMEFLTEMRQVVIVFVNLVFKPNSRLKLIRQLNESYNTLSAIVSYHEGIVNKVSLFDKDTMYLVVFGLRGFKHDTEPQKGLRCAAELYNTFSGTENIITCSIGVTTGTTYCGVVGHDLRREYSVISIAVNKGARLMINYPNRVSCDLETFLGSKMDAKHFIMQVPKQLKGLKSSGPIYKFQEILG
jgi:adenylate cyclase 10